MTYGFHRPTSSRWETAYERGYGAGWHGETVPVGSVEFERGFASGQRDRERAAIGFGEPGSR